jgi:hypothetical protein
MRLTAYFLATRLGREQNVTFTPIAAMKLRIALWLAVLAIGQVACSDGTLSVSSPSPSSTAIGSPVASLNPKDQAEAAATVKKFFDDCQNAGTNEYGISTSPCPQRVPIGDCWFYAPFCVGTTFKWRLVGDPSSNLRYYMDSRGDLQAVGHYLMVASFSLLDPGILHDISGGPFLARLQRISSSAFYLSDLVAGRDDHNQFLVKAPGLTDPGADPSAVMAAVKRFFEACASSTLSNGAPDCPATVPGGCLPRAVGAAWSIKGDPAAGARVTWNPDVGVYSVDGTYTFHVSIGVGCSDRPPFEQDVGGLYWATVTWTPSVLEVIQIGGMSD